MSYTAKSVVLDIADNWGHVSYIGIRSVDFYLSGSLIALNTTNFTVYYTSQLASSYPATAIFNTSLSKIGDWAITQWLSAPPAANRISCVFNSDIEFDSIVVNNSHASGSNTTSGAKNVKIYISSDSITNNTYGAEISNSTQIFDGQFQQHIASNVADPKIISLIDTGGGETQLTDIAIDIQAFLRVMNDAGLDIAAGYQAIEFCPIDIQVFGEASRDNMLDIAVGFLDMIDLPLSVMLSKEINMNVVMDILLSSGIITRNMVMDINVGDGNKRQDLGVDIMAVTSRPEFRYVYAMNLSSVIKEIQA